MLVPLVLIFFVSALLAGQLNRAIYRLAYDRRRISPWSKPPEKAPPRRWSDRLPIVGWLGLRREATLHGKGFWIRPMLIELSVAIGLAWLYHSHLSGELLPPALARDAAELQSTLVIQWAAQSILICLMVVATFIDFDESTIPDAITVPGTALALLGLWSFPAARLIVPNFSGGAATVDFLHFNSPWDAPAWAGSQTGLALGLGIFLIWCFALLDRRWITRKGLRRAVGFFLHGVFRNPLWLWVLGLAVVGAALITTAWAGGGERWQSLLTSLCGLGAGGGIVWAIRIIGKAGLNKEAMGFGDVTLMAMVGAFLGWQPATIAFFVAPFAGILFALVQAFVAGERRLPYGPYLSIGSLVVMLNWGWLWPYWAVDVFALGPLLAGLFFVLLLLMYVMLLAIRLIKSWFAPAA